jgi:tRNA pseudouridine38-40 synthase
VSGILLTVAYEGSRFSGFARQPNARTIAGELLGAVQALDPAVRDVRGASRTDAGVHARGQRVAFDSASGIPPRGWVLGTARHLPPEIAVVRAATVPEGFTPRFANQGKRYAYRVLCSPVRDPFLEGRVWRVGGLSAEALLAAAREAAPAALGTHDFAAFRSSQDERTTTVRTLRRFEAAREPTDARVVRVDVAGDAFLHNMVRILVGTLVDLAMGRAEPGAFARALTSRARTDVGITAPPDGLCL